MFLTIKTFFRKLFLIKIIFCHQIKFALLALSVFLIIGLCTTIISLLIFRQQQLQVLTAPSPTPSPATTPPPTKIDQPTPDLTQEITISPATPLYQADNLISPWYEQYFFDYGGEQGLPFVDQKRGQKLQQIIAQKRKEHNCGRSYVNADFANILSLTFDNCDYFLNLRLDTMAEIAFSDLWLPGTDTQTMIKQAIKKAFFDSRMPEEGDWEAAYFSALEEYTGNVPVPTGSFAIENTQIRVPLPVSLNSYSGVELVLEHFTIPFSDHRDQAVVYRKFLTQEQLFSPAPTQSTYVFYNPFNYYDGIPTVHYTQSNNDVYYTLNVPFPLDNISANIENQAHQNVAVKQLDYLKKQIEQQLSAMPSDPDEITVVDLSIVQQRGAFYGDDSLQAQIDNTFGIGITGIRSLKIPKVMDGLSVVERLDWAFGQLNDNKHNFPDGEIKITADNNIFDQNGTDVTERFCFLDGNYWYLLKNSTAMIQSYKDYHADQNCQITEVN